MFLSRVIFLSHHCLYAGPHLPNRRHRLNLCSAHDVQASACLSAHLCGTHTANGQAQRRRAKVEYQFRIIGISLPRIGEIRIIINACKFALVAGSATFGRLVIPPSPRFYGL
jgi:hypothetical protein